MVRTGIIGKLNWVIDMVNRLLVENENKKPEVDRKIRVYGLDMRERDVVFPITNEENKVVGTKKGYYATVILYYVLEGKTYLVWREEYRFVNATERRKDYLWKERLCDKILYEAVGVFLTIAEKDEPAEFDLEEDQFTNIVAELQEKFNKLEVVEENHIKGEE